ncbi:3',5'-cyclic-AMP phosphodiesterase [Kaarinaea lacus]
MHWRSINKNNEIELIIHTMIHVAQITDTHLFANPGGELYGINTRDSLRAVIAHARVNLPKLDLLLVTGDLVHDETMDGYLVLRELVEQLEVPTYYLPGNHDDPVMMQEVFSNVTRKGITSTAQGQWSVVLLDSSIPDKVEGELTAENLANLEEALRASNDRHVLIALHHHVVDVESPWIDALKLRNNDEFLELLTNFPNVKIVLNGHIHQELDECRNSIRFLGSPSTCFQFKPNQENASIDTVPAGYRHIVLHDDGSVDSRVYYVES